MLPVLDYSRRLLINSSRARDKRLSLFGSIFLGALLSLVWGAEQASAVPAAPMRFDLEQPSGATFRAQLFGDEWNNGIETATGYTILRGRNGRWEYAERIRGGALRPSGRVVGRAAPPGPKHLRDASKASAATALQQETEDAEPSEVVGAPWIPEPERSVALGTHKSLVILAQFNDQSNLGTSAAQWSEKYFGADNSVKHYYNEVSYGQFSIAPATESFGTANDGVVGWVNVPMDHPDTTEIGDLHKQLTSLAIQAANPYVNYASYDTNADGYVSNTELHVTVIAAGQEASCCQDWGAKFLWGHRWAIFGNVQPPVVDGKYVGAHGYTQFGEKHGDHQAAIGIMVHEIGHDLDWPDLYDGDGSSDGVGIWSVMGGGSWNKIATDPYQGDTPPHPDSWSKWFKGWIEPQAVAGTQTKQINASASAAKTNVAVRMLDNATPHDWSWQGTGSGEYFLVENRQRIIGSYDESLPGNGLLVLHVNEAKGNNNTDTNRLVDVEEADGLNELDVAWGDQGDQTDLYRGDGTTSFTAATNPNSNLISGAASGVSMTNVGPTGTTMSATFTGPGGSAPANDGFAGATTISNRTFTATANNSAATIEQDEYAQVGCPLGGTLWFKYAPTRDVRVRIDTQNSDFDTVLNVWRGTSLASLQAQACNDDVDPNANQRWSRVAEFVANAGQTYYFQVGGYYDEPTDTVARGSLTFNFNARPVNDDYVSAQTISGTSGTISGNNVNGTKETNEANHGGNIGGSSIWYRWTAPGNGTVTFDTLNSTVTDTLLGAYTGAVVNGTSVAQNDDIDEATNRRSRVTFPVTQGTVYSIAVDGYGPDATYRGDLTLNWSFAQPSANIAIQKTATRNGGQITYSLAVSNAGPDAAQAVTVTDVLPDKVAHVSSSTTAGTCSGTTTVTCSLGALANGGQATVTIVTDITATGTITNTGAVSSTTSDPVSANNSSSASTTVEAPASANVSIDKSVARDGDAVTYTLLIGNAGPDAAEGVVVTDTIPAKVDYTSYESNDALCTGDPNVSCDVGTLASGASATIVLHGTRVGYGTISNTATVTSTTADPAAGNNSDTADFSVAAPVATDLSASGDVSDPFDGPEFLFNFYVARSAAEGAGDVSATITLPSTVRYEMMYANGSCTGTTTITCNFGEIGMGQSAAVEIMVTPKTHGPHAATLTLDDVDASPANNTASAIASTAFVCDNTPTGGADVVVGTSGAEVLCGLGGNDNLKGAGGDDLIFGGDGTDTVSYKGSPHAVVVNLNFQSLDAEGAWPRKSGTAAHGMDHFTGIERAQGSSFGDFLLGRTSKGDVLFGLGGADLMYGYGGTDTLNGGDANDTLYGGGAYDYLIGGGGTDFCRDKTDSRKTCEK